MIKFIFFSCLAFLTDVSSAGHTPCTYPVPSDKNYKDLCSPYLNIEYLCDTDGVVSKTAADQIHSAITKHDRFTNGEVSVAIAAMQNLNLPNVLPESSDLLVDLEWYCFTAFTGELNEMLKWNNSTTVTRYLEWFTKVLRRRWFRSDCGSHVMFLVVTDSVGDSENPVINWPLVQVSFGQELLSILGDDFCKSLIKSVLAWNSEGMAPSATITQALDHIAEKLNDKSSTENPFKGIPFWAIMSFFGCFLTVVFCVLLDYIIVRKSNLSARKTKDSDAVVPGRKSEHTSVHLLF